MFSILPTFNRRYLVVACLLLAVGCRGRTASGPLPALSAASGVVTLDGQPVAKAAVYFYPVAPGGAIAQATTGADGSFRLDTDGSVGAAAGTYKVVVVRPERDARKSGKRTLPAYSARERTPHQVTLPHDGVIRVELKS